MLPCSVLLFRLSFCILSVLPVFSFFISHQMPQTPVVWQREINNKNTRPRRFSVFHFLPIKLSLTFWIEQNIPVQPSWIRGKKTPGFPLEGDVVKLKWDERIPRAGREAGTGWGWGWRWEILLLLGGLNIPHPPPGTLRGALQNYRLFSSSNLVNQKRNGKN